MTLFLRNLPAIQPQMTFFFLNMDAEKRIDWYVKEGIPIVTIDITLPIPPKNMAQQIK
ncbi:MAG: hypothetical protein K8S18_08525 [Desulfobacula sp.]|nr:hypothetical protein [Desulfobacula sp.]